MKKISVKQEYRNTIAYYNTYFNAKEIYNFDVKKINLANPDHFDRLLTFYKPKDEATAVGVNADMDQIIKKMTALIQIHDNSDWVDDAYILMGKAYYIKGNYLSANDNFQYVYNNFDDPIIKEKAIIWSSRCYMKLDKDRDAEAAIDLALSGDKKALLKNSDELYSTAAKFYLSGSDTTKARKMIQLAFEHSPHKENKARFSFIIAQLFQLQGHNDEASSYYKKTLALHPSYEMSFESRLGLAGLATGNSNIVSELENLLKEEKNADYKDQIYFALAGIYNRNRKTEQAISLYQKSLDAGIGNSNQKGLDYSKLAEIFLNQKHDYQKASAYYDSTMAFLDKEDPSFVSLQKKQGKLGELVSNYKVIEQEDTLLALSNLAPSARTLRAANIIRQQIAKQKAVELANSLAYSRQLAAANLRNASALDKQQGLVSQGYNPAVPQQGSFLGSASGQNTGSTVAFNAPSTNQGNQTFAQGAGSSGFGGGGFSGGQPVAAQAGYGTSGGGGYINSGNGLGNSIGGGYSSGGSVSGAGSAGYGTSAANTSYPQGSGISSQVSAAYGAGAQGSGASPSLYNGGTPGSGSANYGAASPYNGSTPGLGAGGSYQAGGTTYGAAANYGAGGSYAGTSTAYGAGSQQYGVATTTTGAGGSYAGNPNYGAGNTGVNTGGGYPTLSGGVVAASNGAPFNPGQSALSPNGNGLSSQDAHGQFGATQAAPGGVSTGSPAQVQNGNLNAGGYGPFQESQNTAGGFNGGGAFGVGDAGGGSSFYFSNSFAMSTGYAQFVRRWGRRSLRDNWRFNRASGTSSGGGGANDSVSALPLGRILEKPSQNPKKALESLLKLVPSTQGQKDSAVDIIVEASERNAVIYEVGLNDIPKTINTYVDVLAQFPSHRSAANFNFQLYRLYRLTGNTAEADRYKNIVLEQYGKSKYAIYFKNPETLVEKKQVDTALEKGYATAFNAFAKKDYATVFKTYAQVSKTKKDNYLQPQFQYLYVLSIGRTQPLENFEPPLRQFASTYEGTPLGKEAGHLLAQIDSNRFDIDDRPIALEGGAENGFEMAAYKAALKEAALKAEKAKQAAERAAYYHSDFFSPFVFIVSLKNRKISLNTIRLNLSLFAQSNFEKLGLKSSTTEGIENRLFLTITSLPDFATALHYYRKFETDRANLIGLDDSQYDYFFISRQNLLKLTDPDKYRLYQEFFERMYTPYVKNERPVPVFDKGESPGVTSLAAKKDTLASSNPDKLFTYREDAPYLAVIVVKSTRISLNGTRLRLSLFDESRFPDKKIIHENKIIEDKMQFIAAGPFVSLSEAKVYFNALSKNINEIAGVDPSLLTTFLITKENLNKLRKTADEALYETFFTKKYSLQ